MLKQYPMLRYVLQKAFWYLLTFVVAVAINFTLPRMGENNPELRERVCKELSYFGVEIDMELNAKTLRQPNTVELSTPNSKVKVYVLPTNEELMIAKDTEAIVSKL